MLKCSDNTFKIIQISHIECLLSLKLIDNVLVLDRLMGLGRLGT